MRAHDEPLCIEDLRCRPAISVRELHTYLKHNVSMDALYEMIARGEAPWPILRIGRRILIPTAPLLASLGLDTATPVHGQDQESVPSNSSTC
jgi:hypothetical protein